MGWKFMDNIGKVLTGKKDLIDKKTALGKLDLGGLRQMSKLTGGGKERSEQLRRYGHAATGAAAGAIGGPAGMVGGAALGYQSDKAVTPKEMLKDSAKGAAAGMGVLGFNAATSALAAPSVPAVAGSAGTSSLTASSIAPSATSNPWYSSVLSGGLDGAGNITNAKSEQANDELQKLEQMRLQREQSRRQAFQELMRKI